MEIWWIVADDCFAPLVSHVSKKETNHPGGRASFVGHISVLRVMSANRNRTEGYKLVLSPDANPIVLAQTVEVSDTRGNQAGNQQSIEFSPPITYIGHARIQVARELSALLLGQCDPSFNIKRWPRCSSHNATGLGNQRVGF